MCYNDAVNCIDSATAITIRSYSYHYELCGDINDEREGQREWVRVGMWNEVHPYKLDSACSVMCRSVNTTRFKCVSTCISTTIPTRRECLFSRNDHARHIILKDARTLTHKPYTLTPSLVKAASPHTILLLASYKNMYNEQYHSAYTYTHVYIYVYTYTLQCNMLSSCKSLATLCIRMNSFFLLFYTCMHLYKVNTHTHLYTCICYVFIYSEWYMHKKRTYDVFIEETAIH